MKTTLLSLAFVASAALLQAQETSPPPAPAPAPTPLPATTAPTPSEPTAQLEVKPSHGIRHILPPLFVALDANKDGEISQEELSAATTSLKTLDKNGDGKLSREESFRLNPPHKEGEAGGPDQHNGEGRPPHEDGPRREGRPPRQDGPRSEGRHHREDGHQGPPAGER